MPNALPRCNNSTIDFRWVNAAICADCSGYCHRSATYPLMAIHRNKAGRDRAHHLPSRSTPRYAKRSHPSLLRASRELDFADPRRVQLGSGRSADRDRLRHLARAGPGRHGRHDRRPVQPPRAQHAVARRPRRSGARGRRPAQCGLRWRRSGRQRGPARGRQRHPRPYPRQQGRQPGRSRPRRARRGAASGHRRGHAAAGRGDDDGRSAEGGTGSVRRHPAAHPGPRRGAARDRWTPRGRWWRQRAAQRRGGAEQGDAQGEILSGPRGRPRGSRRDAGTRRG